jgi:C1A family cysteine protease
MPITAADITRLQELIRSRDLHWVAGLNGLASLSEDQLKLRLGADPTKTAARLTVAQDHALAATAVSYPASWDWRAVNGQNYVTSVKDQGGCGSCVAFGTVGAIEGAYQVAHNNPNSGICLSEAQMFYCYGKEAGATCASGWWPDQALTDAQNQGLVDCACFPYTAGDQNCNLCANASSRETRITGYQAINNVAQMKQWISSHGPVSTCFTVYDDFFSYTSGVYTPTSTTVAGGHCVVVIGYNDSGRYWICKNSWGTGWGESGFFCIAYDVCGIDAEMWAIDGILETGWLMYPPNPTVLGLWAINQDQNAWAYLNGYGWRKISPDNDNICEDMLSQLIAAKAAGRPLSVYQNNGVITQLYVW